MAILLRLIALAAVWGYSRWSRANSAVPSLLGIDRLSWTRKGQLVWRLAQDSRVPLPARAAVLVPAIYMLSPIDILPDFIPAIGRIDDAAIFSIAMDVLVRFAPVEVVSEHLQAVTGRRPPSTGPSEAEAGA